MPMPETAYPEVQPIERPSIFISAKPANLTSVMDERFNAELQHLLAVHRAAPNLHFLLAQIVGSLPANRDWLDPTVEAFAQRLLNELDALKPAHGALHV